MLTKSHAYLELQTLFIVQKGILYFQAHIGKGREKVGKIVTKDGFMLWDLVYEMCYETWSRNGETLEKCAQIGFTGLLVPAMLYQKENL